MSDKLFDALEISLQALEQGETIDSALTRFPALAEELRPILEASLQARQLAGAPISDVVQRRGRAKLLQRASKLREAKRAPRQRTWLFTFRPLAVTFILAFFFLTSTGLVRASATTLPGDNLYPVKRTWEDLTFLFISQEDHDTLEMAYETERVEEVNELLAEGRTETVSFSGYVNSQADGQWTVAGVPVRVTNETNLPSLPIGVGAPIMVTGRTDAQGFLVAESIETVAPGSIVPEIEDDEEDHEDGNQGDQNNNGNEDNEGEDESGSSSGKEAAGDSTREPASKLEGIIQTITGKYWVVNGRNVDVSGVAIIGQAAPGANVIIEGYFHSDGTFFATRITFVGGEGGDSNSNGSGGSINDNGDNENEDNDANDNNDNDDHEDNSNDGGDNGNDSNSND